MILSSEDAFTKVDGEISIAIDYTQHDFQFTRNWFRQRNQSTWSTFLLQKYGNDRPVKMVQIGVFEGMDLVWCFQNFLGHPDSHVIGIDPWLGTTKLDDEFMQKVRVRALKNLYPQIAKDKLTLTRGLSQNVLPGLGSNLNDLVIIDGDHNADAVLVDAVESLRIAKSGAWLVFDDVRNRIPKKDHVQAGLDKFLEQHGHLVQLEWRHRYCDCYSKK